MTRPSLDFRHWTSLQQSPLPPQLDRWGSHCKWMGSSAFSSQSQVLVWMQPQRCHFDQLACLACKLRYESVFKKYFTYKSRVERNKYVATRDFSEYLWTVLVMFWKSCVQGILEDDKKFFKVCLEHCEPLGNGSWLIFSHHTDFFFSLFHASHWQTN